MTAAREHGPEGDRTRPRPPVGGWTAEDLDRLPGLPPRTEPIDGEPAHGEPRTLFHTRTTRLLEWGLCGQAPEHLHAVRSTVIPLGERDRPEPDLTAVQRGARTGPGQTWYDPGVVLLAVEVVPNDSSSATARPDPASTGKRACPTTGGRSRRRASVVHVHELDPATESYARSGVFHDRPRSPFPSSSRHRPHRRQPRLPGLRGPFRAGSGRGRPGMTTATDGTRASRHPVAPVHGSTGPERRHTHG